MCEFCLRHGEGKKWYLRAENYSADLLSDARRRRFVEKFFDGGSLRAAPERLEALDRIPRFLRRAVAWRAGRKMKKWHFGQVVPIEEIEEILGFVNSIVRVACVCRLTTVGAEKRFCYGVSLGPGAGGIFDLLKGLDRSFLSGPDTAGFETMNRAEALAAMKELEKEGLCHTVWTFRTPYIGGICNCDRADCLAMRATLGHDVPMMFRAEFVAEIDPDSCTGCRECRRVCPFGALEWSVSSGKASVDQRHCWGCGVCRSACPPSAIRLLDRARVPAAAGVW